MDAVSGNPKSPLRWRLGDSKSRLLGATLFILFGAYALAFLVITAERMRGSPPAGDFFALWSVGRLAWERLPTELYDPAALKAAQVVMGMDPGTNYPFPYPPSFLLALAPLGLLPLLPAYMLAMAITVALYAWAVAGTRGSWPLWLAAVLAPTTTITVVAGQAGLLTAALLAGGFRLAAKKPAIAGVLFALATYKPQFGMLVPVALVAARLWRTIAAACATVATLVVITGLIYGAAVWPAWAANIVQYSRQFAAESSEITYLMPTVSVNLMRLGAGATVAFGVQLAAAIIAGGIVWRCFRADSGLLAPAALFVATALAMPHAFVYDMPVVTVAILWFITERARSGEAFDSIEVAAMMVAMIAPIAAVAGSPLMTLVSLVVLLAIIVRRFRGAPVAA